ncbi:integumentary mucin B.1-like [Latimeria chalumnae]|uniref:integumentary mucin B.1-like n=1 Tax=Latimeria chalumnae TaxID=7897 RepID=UPI0006D91203|nr:PREDICTED: submaxillary mucin-like protein [Latimeria chalumnae]|eukprot:XP_006008502.2 PREDICTED: submaxillary mucin-like protein [Latimeria chalumnae]
MTHNAAGACCPIFYCEPVMCHYNGQSYAPGQKWVSTCHECSCDNVTKSIECKKDPCPTKVCGENKTLKVDMSNSTCCPVAYCVQDSCEYKGQIYMPGDEWESNCSKCTCNSKKMIDCKPVPCPQQPICKGDEKLIVENSNNPCCPITSYCAPIVCELNGKIIKLGDTIQDSENPCLYYTCHVRGLESIVEKCESQPDCPEEYRDYKKNNCCYTCTKECYTVPVNVTVTEKSCTATITMAKCKGVCNTFTNMYEYDYEKNEMVFKGLYCHKAKEEDRTVTLNCTNGKSYDYTYKHITSCKFKKS